MFFRFVLMILFFLTSHFVFAKNLHLIDQNQDSGYALYRTGAPNEKDFFELCQLGVEEIWILSGNPEKYEYKHQKVCPSLKVYRVDLQNPRIALSANFLEDFDRWIEDAKAQGKKIAFRCNCGCHRTGRLAAYYRMKYMNYTENQAIHEMFSLGKWMWFYPELYFQVKALRDYIDGQKCSVKSRFCVKS